MNGGGSGRGGRGGGGEERPKKILKKGMWSRQEDEMLTKYVRRNGGENWNAVQRHTPLLRCGKSCRLRWANHLRPDSNKGAFSPEEESLVVRLHAEHGNNGPTWPPGSVPPPPPREPFHVCRDSRRVARFGGRFGRNGAL